MVWSFQVCERLVEMEKVSVAFMVLGVQVVLNI